MRYQYQIDYGNGYEDFYPHEADLTRTGEESSSAWLASVEAEGTAYRARNDGGRGNRRTQLRMRRLAEPRWS